MLLILFAALLIVIWYILDDMYIYGNTLDRKILQYKPGVSVTDSPEQSPILDDMAAWITINDTAIDYPVMQAKDNAYFLNTDPFGDYSLSGSIFLDCRNAREFTDPYSIIYGHHMERGKMFGALDAFLDKTYLAQHRDGTLILGKDAHAEYPLEVFASMQANARDSIVFDPESKEDIRAYIQSHAAVYLHNRDCRIAALSTCSGVESAFRIIVFCYILETAS